MRILVLGGTSFVGRAIVDDALSHGADVTLFGRGKTGTDLFPGTQRLIGDRDTGDYEALRSGSWDAVADVSGYVPRHVGQAMDALGDRAGRYLFISSHVVTYGPLKVACEDDVVARYGQRGTIAARQGRGTARLAGRAHLLGATGGRARRAGHHRRPHPDVCRRGGYRGRGRARAG